MLFLAQTQEHKDNGLNLLLRVLNNVFHLQMTSFARSPFCTTYLCDKWSKSDLCICRGSGSHSSEIREVWPIRRASLGAYQWGEKKRKLLRAVSIFRSGERQPIKVCCCFFLSFSEITHRYTVQYICL